MIVEMRLCGVFSLDEHALIRVPIPIKIIKKIIKKITKKR